MAPSGRLKLGRHMASDPSEADGPGRQGSQSDGLDPLGPSSNPPTSNLVSQLLCSFPSPCGLRVHLVSGELLACGGTHGSLCVRVRFSDDHMEGHFVKQLRTEFCISKERASLADVHLPGAMTQPLSWPSGGS